MERVVVSSTKYDGKYIALNNQLELKIVGAGNTPSEALNDAKKKGFSKPYIIYAPKKELALVD